MSLFKVLRGSSSRIGTDVTPFHDGYAYFTTDDAGFYIDAEVSGTPTRVRINKPTRTIAASLVATAWVGGQQTIAIDGMTAQTNGVISLVQDLTEAQSAAGSAAALRVVSQDDGVITVAAGGIVPIIDLPVSVMIFA